MLQINGVEARETVVGREDDDVSQGVLTGLTNRFYLFLRIC